MSSVIITLNQSDFDSSVAQGDRDNYVVRRAVRAVITDDDGRVPLLHARQRDYYKIPGGGVEEDEDLRDALAREVMEEIGSKVEVIGELGTTEEWRDERRRHQTSHCFVARIVGDKGTPTFTDEEIEEGFEVVWAENIDNAIKLAERATRSDDMDVWFMASRDTGVLRAAKERV